MFVSLYIKLILFDLALHVRGFNKIFSEYSVKYYVEKGYDISSIDSNEMIKDLYLLDLVCAWYPRKADCIHKTLIGYRMFGKKFNIPLEMVVGIRKFPFEAHTWLRIHGQSLINEEDDEIYKVVLSSNTYVRDEEV